MTLLRTTEDTTMTDNRERVDVLAALDTAIGIDRVTELRPVRDAVAELIEADREFDAASEAWDAIPGPPDGCTDDRDYDSAEYRRLCVAIGRRQSALARLAPMEDAK